MMTNPARTIANSHEGSKSASKIPTAKAITVCKI